MSKGAGPLPLAGLKVARGGPEPLYRQLYQTLRAAILSGRLRPGLRLPSTRALAADLELSRNTVINAYEQLTAEGYLEGRIGSGTYVARSLPEDLLQAGRYVSPLGLPAEQGAGHPTPPVEPWPARADPRSGIVLPGVRPAGPDLHVGAGLAASADPPRPFRPGVPALDAFPFRIWAKLTAQRWRSPPPELLTYGDPAGYAPLREALAEYLGTARGVRCDPAQVVVVAGAQQALHLIARLLLEPGDRVLIEDPGYPGARAAFASAGARLVPGSVDAEGLMVGGSRPDKPAARVAYVTPSHQYPLGVTMSLPRRLALLDWAYQTGAWVVEDDYDSEFRFSGRPLAALQGLDRYGRVIYLGTFSKVLFPSLRLGYVVAPPALAAEIASARAINDRGSPILSQAIVADFMAQGHFHRHLRRMRTLYASRQQTLIECLQQSLSEHLDVNPSPAGLQLVAWLRNEINDRVAARHLSIYNVEASPLSRFALVPHAAQGLVLGFGGFPQRSIREAVDRMARALMNPRLSV